MKKIWLRIFCIVMFASVLMIQAEKGGKFNGNIQKETDAQEEQNMKGGTEESGFEGYQTLDVNLFESESLVQVVVDRAAEYTEEGNKAFVPVVSEDSSFPEGLVVKMEKVLYQTKDPLVYADWVIEAEEEVRSRIQGEYVSGAMYTEFGLQDFRLTTDLEELGRLFPKAAPVYYKYDGETSFRDTYEWISRYYDIPEDISHIHRMELLPGKDNYLFESYRVGVQRNRIRLTERMGDEFRTIYEFDIPFTLTTGVIQYEGKFYFITVDEDINVKAEYGVTIYSLDYDSPGNSISIHYQPEKYAAESYGIDSGKLTPLIESGYMDKVLEDFSSGKYLHEGNQKDGAEIYYGDEERAFEEELESSTNEIYKMDITNRGYPVYLCKDIYLPWEDDVRRKNKQLGVDFFYFDTENMYFQKLEELSIPKKYCEAGYLVQMWFKKMGGEVYVFRVYNLANYNYLMNVALVDGDKTTSVGNYFLWPRKQFVLEDRHIEENVIQGDRHFKVTYEEDFKYHYVLYDRKGNVLKEGEEKKQPLIMYIDEATILLEVYGEKGEWYTVYYDIEHDRLSETYLNPVAAGEGKTAYLKQQGEDMVVAVKNIFDGDYYEEFLLDRDTENITFKSTGFIKRDTLYIDCGDNEWGGTGTMGFDLHVDRQEEQNAAL